MIRSAFVPQAPADRRRQALGVVVAEIDEVGIGSGKEIGHQDLPVFVPERHRGHGLVAATHFRAAPHGRMLNHMDVILKHAGVFRADAYFRIRTGVPVSTMS